MLLNPAILALLLVSAVVLLMVIMAGLFAIRLLLHWDIDSGSERQLRLERRTYLISTMMSWIFAFELLSLLLFVYTAESLSGQFVGAMCATGVLNANAWGWPTLFLKITLFFGGALWLALNGLDNRGYDYPLIRRKYVLLLLLVPLVAAEVVSQLRFFLGLSPNIITSCCGTLFSSTAQGVAAEVSTMPPNTMAWALALSGVAVLVSGLGYLKWRRGASLLALTSIIAFVTALLAVVSLLSPYIYEHPHHHCPFCILKSGHGYVGYLLYIPLFGATAFGLAAAATAVWRKIPSLKTCGSITLGYTRLSVVLFLFFYLISAWSVLSSNLVMQGVWW
ncbi:MAG: hypothetical protein PVI97_12220 [Candidatus Thiodiazotropha sp.]|jgi:hypothetical protein